jgi:hypothetical protein
MEPPFQLTPLPPLFQEERGSSKKDLFPLSSNREERGRGE